MQRIFERGVLDEDRDGIVPHVLVEQDVDSTGASQDFEHLLGPGVLEFERNGLPGAGERQRNTLLLLGELDQAVLRGLQVRIQFQSALEGLGGVIQPTPLQHLLPDCQPVLGFLESQRLSQRGLVFLIRGLQAQGPFERLDRLQEIPLFKRSSAPFLVRRRDPAFGGVQLGLNGGIEGIVFEGVLIGRHGPLPVALLHESVGKRGVRSIERGAPGQQA